MCYILLQATDVPQAKILTLSLVILGAALLGLFIVARVKRRLQATDEPVPTGFTLADLRQMHKAGQITAEEYERARAKIVEHHKKVAEREAAEKAGAAKPRTTRSADVQDGLDESDGPGTGDGLV